MKKYQSAAVILDPRESMKEFEERFKLHWKKFREACPSPELMYQYENDPEAVIPEKREAVRKHLEICEICRLQNEKAKWMEQEIQAMIEAGGMREREVSQNVVNTVSVDKPKAWTLSQVLPGLSYAISLVFLMIVLPVFVYKLYKSQREIYFQESQLHKEVQRSEELDNKVRELLAKDKQKDEQIAELTDRVREARQIYANPFSQILNLPLRSIEAAPLIKMPADAQILNLGISFPEKKAYSRYRVEIGDISGVLLLQSENLKRDEYGHLKLAIAKKALEAKEYVLKIYGMMNGKYDLIGEYHFRITIDSNHR